MMYETRRRKPEPTLSPTQVMLTSHNIYARNERKLAFVDPISYTPEGMDYNADMCYGSDGIRTPVPRVPNPVP